MKVNFCFIIILMMLTLMACQKDIPKPESEMVIESTQIASASEFWPMIKERFTTKHYIRGNTIFVECVITNFSFRNTENNQSGKMVVYVDGKRKQVVSSAAFIIKDLAEGDHRITLQIVNNNGQKTSLKKEFMVAIP